MLSNRFVIKGTNNFFLISRNSFKKLCCVYACIYTYLKKVKNYSIANSATVWWFQEKMVLFNNERDRRNIFVDILAVLFGISSWISINGLWVELPLLVERLPEAWTLASYLSVIVQLANIGPITIGLVRYFSNNCQIILEVWRLFDRLNTNPRDRYKNF